jgi:hypothetical protein
LIHWLIGLRPWGTPSLLLLGEEPELAEELAGLLPFSFQFFTRLAAVFAEEVGGFGMVVIFSDGQI